MKPFAPLCCLPLVLALAAGPVAAHPPPETTVSGLYQQVVARHPLGIPYGEDKAAFTPYLSQALLKRFDARLACDADWRRQNPDPDLKPPGPFEDGLFSGSSEQSEPRAFAIGRSEPQPDGALRVHVRLSIDEIPMTWTVAAVVARENGRPVIDDVLFLETDDATIDGRLSETLAAGCDGPKWVR